MRVRPIERAVLGREVSAFGVVAEGDAEVDADVDADADADAGVDADADGDWEGAGGDGAIIDDGGEEEGGGALFLWPKSWANFTSFQIPTEELTTNVAAKVVMPAIAWSILG